jgi:hypothetical protein
MSSVTSTCPSHCADAPMPMVGMATARVISVASSSITPSSTTAKAPASATAWRRQDLGRFRLAPPARAIAAKRVHRLRGEADMGDHRNAALGQEADGRRHRLAALPA